ncbi:uncharacterized protein METZ01_LOCUS79530 [marine metagenome]|uniref:Uncharacterized protein n=1 Tax=marine metagenome TaxID=408172 RepID=A0A381UEN3_9ZZZZ
MISSTKYCEARQWIPVLLAQGD